MTRSDAAADHDADEPRHVVAQTMAPVVQAVIASALHAARERSGPGDVAHGLIAGLRHLRTAADEQGGYAVAAAIDTAVRTRILAENLEAARRDGRRPDPVALPAAGPALAVATAILENAADSCLAVNAHAPDNGPLEIAVFALTGQLIQHLGGAPDWRDVERELHRPSARHGAVSSAVLPAAGATVH